MTTMIFFFFHNASETALSFLFHVFKMLLVMLRQSYTYTTAETNPRCTNEQRNTHMVLYTYTFMHTHTQPERRIKAFQPLSTQGERDCIRWTLYLICCHSVWEKNHHTLFFESSHPSSLTYTPQYLYCVSSRCFAELWVPLQISDGSLLFITKHNHHKLG